MAHFTSFDKLLEAMSKIADSSDSKLKYDKTVVMEIIQLIDATTGEYAVKYQGNTLQAFAVDLNAKYNKGDSVYVKIPEGDFTNTKIIEGKVNNKDTTEQERNIISNTIIDVEPSWFAASTYGVLPEVKGLVAGSENAQEIPIWQHDSASAQHTGTDTLLKTYNKEFDKFIIKASFMTNFLGKHIQGNYGLKLTLKIVNMEDDKNPVTKDFILDTTSFTGNVYELSSYSPQYAVFQIPKNSFISAEKLVFFQEGMEVDVWTKPDPSDPTTAIKEEIKTSNIYVKDISVNYVQILDYTQDTYYVLIDTPKGNTLGGNVSEITVSPRLIYKGENIITDSSCEVYWYKENPDVLVGTPLYSAQVGCGWELIDDEKKVSNNVLTISKNDVIIEQRYKVLILYGKKQSPFTGIITVYNSDSKIINAQLLRDTVKDKDYLYIENQEYKGTWYRELPNGSYINLSEQYSASNTTEVTVNVGSNADGEVNKTLKAYNKVNITEFLSYPSFTIYCKIYDKNNNFLVTRHYDINNVGEEADVTVSFEGEKVYRYDANGDIAIEESEKEKTIDGKITWREGAGTAFKVEWVDGYGVSIGTDKIQPKNSMLKEVYVDGYNVLHYMISPKYYNYYQNNSLTMKITTIEEKVYEFPCDILFVKDGEQGTNGTTYITMIRPVDDNGKLDKDFTVFNSNNKTFKAFVYKDGEEIKSGEKGYTFSFEWSGENVIRDDATPAQTLVVDKSNVDISQGKFQINQTNIIQKENNTISIQKPNLFETADSVLAAGAVLKVAVTISHKDLKRKIIVYYNYPIVYSSNNIEGLILETNLPSFVQYESDGTTPSYKYSELYARVKDEEKISKITSYTPDLVNISLLGEKYYLTLASNFLYSAGSAALKIPINDTNYIVYTIMMYRNTYGMAEINGWDGTQMKIDEQGNYLLAAMVGAGSKNDQNQFTGMVMGELSSGETGLFGYGTGERSFFLDANTGNASFGKNGEITITPTNSTIAGKMNGAQRMTLKLNGSSNSDLAINVNNKFTVDYAGNMKATGADITGTITATSGTIGGWEIENDQLTNGALVLDSQGLYIPGNKEKDGWGIYFQGNKWGGSLTIGTYFTITSGGSQDSTQFKMIGNELDLSELAELDLSGVSVNGLNLTAVFG